MKKKLALIIISLDECFSVKGFNGGGHKVTKNLILGLIESNLFNIDIFCRKSNIVSLEGINSINIIENKKNFTKELQNKLKNKNYDYILSSDVLLPFTNNLIHSNSSKYKLKNNKNLLLQQILKIYNSKKIKAQEKCFKNNTKSVFTVSESLKKDYVENFNLDEKRVFVSYPAVDNHAEFIPSSLKENFTIGSIAGGGLNKGGYLLLFALKKLPNTCKLKAKIIFPKFNKSFFFKMLIKLLQLEERIELLPKQENMNEYYKLIDCYVLPSLNEAFGLVVTEAASNFKPGLVSSTAGVGELIKDGENGFIFNRTKTPMESLSKKLVEITDIYFNNNSKFTEISKNAYEISMKLDWKKFTNTVIDNLAEETV